ATGRMSGDRSTTATRLASVASACAACRVAVRPANGTATRAVASTETRATRQVARTTRRASVPPPGTAGTGGSSPIAGVAHATLGTDDRRRLAELGPQLGDVHVHGPGGGVAGPAPHRRQQPFPGQDPTRPAH